MLIIWAISSWDGRVLIKPYIVVQGLLENALKKLMINLTGIPNTIITYSLNLATNGYYIISLMIDLIGIPNTIITYILLIWIQMDTTLYLVQCMAYS